MTFGHDPLEGVGPGGTIATGAHRDRLSIAFRPVLEKAAELLARLDGTPSLFVYGSVATGTARPGNSDVDLVTIGLDAGVSRTLAQRLTLEFSSLCRGVEIGAAQATDYQGPDDEAYGNRVFLRHYCVHLAGPNPRLGLPDFAADRAAARGFNGDIGLHADRWRRAVAGAADPVLLARRIARKTLFAVAGLVSIHDSTWTTDRAAAVWRFGAIRPQLAASLAALVDWGGDGTMRPARSDVQAVLDGAVADVVDAFASRIGLWDAAAPAPVG